VTKIKIHRLFFDKHNKITFNQALLLSNGTSPTMDKHGDEQLAILFKPNKQKSDAMYKLIEDGNIELAKIERKQYFQSIMIYNLLVSTFHDNSPETPTIQTAEFLKWADKNNISNSALMSRNISDVTAKNLYTALSDNRLITGGYSELWKWTSARNQLSYLAKRLKQKRVLGTNCHIELANFIQDPKPDTKRPLKNIKDPSDTSIIDMIVDQLTA